MRVEKLNLIAVTHHVTGARSADRLNVFVGLSVIMPLDQAEDWWEQWSIISMNQKNYEDGQNNIQV